VVLRKVSGYMGTDFTLRLAEATGTEEKLSLLRGLFFLFQVCMYCTEEDY
jgi:hypothetical protein